MNSSYVVLNKAVGVNLRRLMTNLNCFKIWCFIFRALSRYLDPANTPTVRHKLSL